jgi:hypothetical protein
MDAQSLRLGERPLPPHPAQAAQILRSVTLARALLSACPCTELAVAPPGSS